MRWRSHASTASSCAGVIRLATGSCCKVEHLAERRAGRSRGARCHRLSCWTEVQCKARTGEQREQCCLLSAMHVQPGNDDELRCNSAAHDCMNSSDCHCCVSWVDYSTGTGHRCRASYITPTFNGWRCHSFIYRSRASQITPIAMSFIQLYSGSEALLWHRHLRGTQRMEAKRRHSNPFRSSVFMGKVMNANIP
jgi:hypothetical protein